MMKQQATPAHNSNPLFLHTIFKPSVITLACSSVLMTGAVFAQSAVQAPTGRAVYQQVQQAIQPITSQTSPVYQQVQQGIQTMQPAQPVYQQGQLATQPAYPLVAPANRGVYIPSNLMNMSLDSSFANSPLDGVVPNPTSTRGPAQAGTTAALMAERDSGQVEITLDRKEAVADGATPVRANIRIVDAKGQMPRGETWVQISAEGALVRADSQKITEIDKIHEAQNATSAGIQVRAVNGQAVAYIIAPTKPQALTVTASTKDAWGVAAIRFVPAGAEGDKPVVAGLVEAIVFRSNNGTNTVAGANTGGVGTDFEQAITKWTRWSNDGKTGAAARASFFLRGKILGSSLLTLAFDSEKDRNKKSFSDINPEQWYPVYGDASTRGNAAESSDRLYVRIDNDNGYIMYGDFNTGSGFTKAQGGGAIASLRVRDLGNNNRSLTGGRLHFESQSAFVNVYAARINTRQVVEELAGKGVTGPYGVSKAANAVAGTEKVEILIRDRNQPSVILRAASLIRGADYSFESFSGRLLFKEPIPSLDSSLNPVTIRVSYELDQGGDKYNAFGADGQVKIGENAEVGFSYSKDSNPYAPQQIISGNVVLGDKNTAGVIEVAQSKGTGINPASVVVPAITGVEQTTGRAYRAEVVHQSQDLSARAYAGKSDTGFVNPASSLNGGRQEMGLDGSLRIADNISINAQAVRSKDINTEANRTQGALGLTYSPMPALELSIAGTKTTENPGIVVGNGYTVQTPIYQNWGSGFFNGGFNGQNSGSSAGLLPSSAVGNWSNSVAGIPISYTGVKVGARYKATKDVSIGGEYETSTGSGSKYQRANVGADYQINDLSRLYGRYEWNTGASTVASVKDSSNLNILNNDNYRSNAFVLGVDASPVQGTSVFSEMRGGNSLNNANLQWANGIRNSWNVDEYLRINSSLEHLSVAKGQGQASTAASYGFNWMPDNYWNVAMQTDWRRQHRSDAKTINLINGSQVTTQTYAALPSIDSASNTFSVARKLNSDWTALARNYYLGARNENGTKAWEDRFQVGAAYRDSENNKINMLAKYEYWTRKDTQQVLSQGQVVTNSPTDTTGFNKHILSVVADYHPSRPWWMTGRVAYKAQTDKFANGLDSKWSAALVSGRVTYDLSDKIDLSVMASYLKGMTKPDNNGYYALGLEAGYQAVRNLWLSAGYNWAGYSAPDLTGSDYTNKGAYLRMRYKFDQSLFGGE